MFLFFNQKTLLEILLELKKVLYDHLEATLCKDRFLKAGAGHSGHMNPLEEQKYKKIKFKVFVGLSILNYSLNHDAHFFHVKCQEVVWFLDITALVKLKITYEKLKFLFDYWVQTI